MNYRNIEYLLTKFNLVLASGSPRRVNLLKQAGFGFRQIIPDIEENNHDRRPPYQLAVSLAEKKARAIIGKINCNEIILGCDTIVILNDLILGKPKTSAEAVQMLKSLSGVRHTVCSGVVLLSSQGKMEGGYELSDVYFKNVSDRQINEYVSSGEPMDKAGAYGIQDIGVFLVDRVQGNIDNVTGLPMTLLDILAGKIVKDLG